MCMIFKGCDEDSSADMKPKRADDGERSAQKYRMKITSKLPAEIAAHRRESRTGRFSAVIRNAFDGMTKRWL